MATTVTKSIASASSTNQGTSSSTSTPSQEYIVRVPKPDKKRYHVMKFNSSLNVDFASWSQAKIERENNLKDFKTEEDMPKFGAGSEFGRDAREEARKKKYGVISKKYNPDDQPWHLRVGGKSGKRYRGLREGGIAENASYYVFMQAPDGAFEAFPISEWYHFTPVQTYKTLNAEEAEEEFGRRDKVFNYFSIMLKKRLKNEEEEGEGDENVKKKDKKSYKASDDFKISEMDDWVNSSDESNEEDEEAAKSNKEDKKNNKGKDKQQKGKKKKKKKDDSDDEPLEDSDDGDEEGREVDYITDGSSSSEEEPGVKGKGELKGVEDEEAIRKMEESESEEENPETNNETQEETKEVPPKEKPVKKEKKEGSSSESSSDTSDSDDFDNNTSFQSAMFMQDRAMSKAERKLKKESKSNSASRSNTPTKPFDKNVSGGVKWSLPDHEKDGNCAKRIKLEPGISGSPSMGCSVSSDGISEDAVRRYLMRKPMTTTELLQKFKSKKTGLGRDQMVNTITQILKRLNPDKHMIKGKMYLSIKPSL